MRVSLLLFLLGLALSSSAGAQEFSDLQQISNRVLFAAQDTATRQRLAEARRIEELDQTTRRQAVLLQSQASAVQQLGLELRTVREERQLMAIADAFDAAVVAGRWAEARSYLADNINVDLEGRSDAAAQTVSADAFIARMPGEVASTSVLLRSNQRVTVEAEHAVLTASGYAWGRASGSKETLRQKFGRYEYAFEHSSAGWNINAILFRPAAAF